RRGREICLLRLLSFLTRGRIKHSPVFNEFAWVMKTEDPAGWTSAYSQLGYTYPGFIAMRPEYSDTAQLPAIDSIAAADYFSYRGGYNDARIDYLALPDNILDLLDLVANLPEPDRTNFTMASNWLYQSNAIWPISQSASFVALVTAVE